MKEGSTTDSAGVRIQNGTTGDKVLGRLEALLEKHLRLAGDGDFASILKDGAQVENLLRLASESGPDSSDTREEQLKRVIEVHRRLHLLTKTEKEQMQGTLAKVRRGKRALRKYQGGGARLG